MLKKLFNTLFPMRCALCQCITNTPLALCHACHNDLPWLKKSCRQCAAPTTSDQQLCANCLKHSPAFDAAIALFHYQLPIDSMIIQLKFHRELLYAKLLGELLAECLQTREKPDLIIPVPLHLKRLKERTYNQALEIAKPISKRLKIPIDITSCQRIKPTQPQSTLDIKDRKKNVRNAFAITKKITANHIAIIDDVMTTGHTVNELSKILKKSGIKKISLWTIAR